MKPCPPGCRPDVWAEQQRIHEQNRKAVADEQRASNSRPTRRNVIRAHKVSPPLVPLRVNPEVVQ